MNAVESVWDYPRPPRLEPSGSEIGVMHRGIVVAQSRRALRVLETSHPPVFYVPLEDVQLQLLRASTTRPSLCEYKGVASYWDLVLPGLAMPSPADAERLEGDTIADVAWSYAGPAVAYVALRDHLAFYPGKVDECWVDGERVAAQAGDFYGGWITSGVRGPFKGGPGTRGW